MIDWTLAPESGRRDTLIAALKRLHEIEPGGRIVEIGTSRNASDAALQSDGWATRMFGWYALQSGGSVVSIDPNPRAIRNACLICADYGALIDFRCMPSEQAVLSLGPVALLYMDGPSRTDVHIDTWRALDQKPPLVLIDDVASWPPGEDWTGEAPLTFMITTLLAEGYREVFTEGRQMLLEAP
jgi:hypothetical protein